MDVNKSVLACLQFIPGHKEFPIKFFIQFIEDQASFGCHKGAIRICIALVSDITDRLAFCVDLIHHMDKRSLVIPVITIRFCDLFIDLAERGLYKTVHCKDRDFLQPEFTDIVSDMLNDPLLFVRSKLDHYPCRAFSNGSNDF